MADVEEPQFTSLQQRIAALKQQGVGKSLVAPSAVKKGPPPPPPPLEQRPALPTRRDTSNTSTNGFTKKASGQPTGVKTQLLPPPPVDRDQHRPASSSNAPSIPARTAPPPLPSRKSSQPSPALPPRKSSTQLVPVTSNGRRGSDASTISHSSSISGISLSHYGSSTTSTSSAVERKLPPMLGDAKLPPLPPSRRDTEKLASLVKVPLVSTKSAPFVPTIKEPPKMPTRPGAQRILSRNSADMREDERPAMPSRLSAHTRVEEPPTQPPRRLPPKAKVNILSMGFGDTQKPVQDEVLRMPTSAAEVSRSSISSKQIASIAKPISPGVRELTDSNFDSTINSKHYALVEFFGPRCSLCQYLEPFWKELADDFAFASEKLVIGKMNMGDYPKFHNRFGITRYPTILLFANGEKIAKYSSSLHGETSMCHKEKEEITAFLEENSGIRVADAALYKIDVPVPPPINMSTRPSDSESSVRAHPRPASMSECLLCRDFSSPDRVASQYPRESLTHERDVIGYLARALCGPFPSKTDKARAVFTWCHHNIAYDTKSFFSNNIKGTTPENTIRSGLAVCQGYAEAFEAIALKAGLEAIMVTGHGKGFGYKALKAGERPPPYDGNHAWNAVRIDGGEWKLVDPCWGAGPVGNDNVFTKKFNPTMFTISNEDYGLAHYPENKKYFFRDDGVIPTWSQYYIGPSEGEPVYLYSNLRDHGLSESSFLPVTRQISVSSGKTIRFMFSKICEHWDHEKNGKGKPYLILLKLNGVAGKKEDFHPFETNGFWWWADVAAADLGAPGQKVDIYAIDTLNGKDARGLTRDDYLKAKGRCGCSFEGIGYWELVK